MTRREEEKESGGAKMFDRTLLLPLGIMCSLFTIQVNWSRSRSNISSCLAQIKDRKKNMRKNF